MKFVGITGGKGGTLYDATTATHHPRSRGCGIDVLGRREVGVLVDLVLGLIHVIVGVIIGGIRPTVISTTATQTTPQRVCMW